MPPALAAETCGGGADGRHCTLQRQTEKSVFSARDNRQVSGCKRAKRVPVPRSRPECAWQLGHFQCRPGRAPVSEGDEQRPQAQGRRRAAAQELNLLVMPMHHVSIHRGAQDSGAQAHGHVLRENDKKAEKIPKKRALPPLPVLRPYPPFYAFTSVSDPAAAL